MAIPVEQPATSEQAYEVEHCFLVSNGSCPVPGDRAVCGFVLEREWTGSDGAERCVVCVELAADLGVG